MNIQDIMQITLSKSLQSLGFERHLTYAVFTYDKNGIMINNLNHEAWHGHAVFRHDYYFNSNNELKAINYVSPIIKNPTWLDVAILANTAIIATKDYNHNWFEGLEPIKFDKGISFFNILLGS